MGFLGGGILKLLQTLLYAINFCAGAIILGIYSYFLWWLSHNNAYIHTWVKAVEGLAGAGCLYLIFAVLLTCFLGGFAFFAFLGIFLDILFCGAFIAIAVMTRDGANSCGKNDYVHTPVGNGFGRTDIPDAPDLSFMCRLNTAAFAVSIVGAILFAISTLLQLAIGANHRKEKRFGPSPANNYTSGSGNKWFNRRRNKGVVADRSVDPETGVVGGAGGLAVPAHDVRPSHDTAYTGSTVAGNGTGYAGDKYNTAPAAGYHTAPTGTGVNPYGYDTARPTNF